MPDTKISAMTDATTPDGTELVPVVQGGANRKVTLNAILSALLNERVDDRVAALLQAGSGITLTYDDAAGTLTIATSGGGISNEVIDDRVGALLKAGTGISIYYDDGMGEILISSTVSGGGGGLTTEDVDDRVASLLQAGSGITLTYDDAAGTLTIASSGGGGSYTQREFDNNANESISVLAAHAGKVVRCTSPFAVGLTLWQNASVPIPTATFMSYLQATDTGQIVMTVNSGVTLNIPSGYVAKTRARGSVINLHKVGTNEWDLSGDLATS